MACDIAIADGADEIVLLGGFGKRADHSLANIHLLVRLHRKNVKAYIVDDINRYGSRTPRLK